MCFHNQQIMALVATSFLLASAAAGCKGTGNHAYVPKPTSYAYSGPSPAPVHASIADLGASAAATNPDASDPPMQDQSNQQFCPVTGAKLGSMGEPVPVVVGGETVYVCCAACVDKLHSDPQRYLRPSAGGLPDQGNVQRQIYQSTNNDAPSAARETSASRGSSCSHCSH